MALARQPRPKRWSSELKNRCAYAECSLGKTTAKTQNDGLPGWAASGPLPDRFAGCPAISVTNVGPVAAYVWKSARLEALSRDGAVKIDLGACLFCGECCRRVPESGNPVNQ